MHAANITHVLLIRVVDLFTFSHDGNRNKQGERVTLMRLVALSSVMLVFWCSDVAGDTLRNQEEHIKCIECSGMLTECE